MKISARTARVIYSNLVTLDCDFKRISPETLVVFYKGEIVASFTMKEPNPGGFYIEYTYDHRLGKVIE